MQKERMYTYGRMQMEVLNLYQQYGGAGGLVGTDLRYAKPGEKSDIKRGTAGGGGASAYTADRCKNGSAGSSYASRFRWMG